MVKEPLVFSKSYIKFVVDPWKFVGILKVTLISGCVFCDNLGFKKLFKDSNNPSVVNGIGSDHLTKCISRTDWFQVGFTSPVLAFTSFNTVTYVDFSKGKEYVPFL